MVAIAQKLFVQVPELVLRRQAKRVSAARDGRASAPAAKGSRPSFLIDHAHTATRCWFAGWMSSRLY